jgi:cell cycle sensor histidine kinase DivJ
VRNLRVDFVTIFRGLSGYLDGFVHPAVAEDAWQKPRHKMFLASSLVSGSAALVVLPLHLALAGPTTLPTTMMLAFLLGQWPLALFLAQSGNLERAYGYSAAYFSVFLTGLCALTGGLSSFALIWFATVPMEAALSGCRRIITMVCGLCIACLVFLGAGPVPAPAWEAAFPVSMLTSVLAACGYMTLLALRLAFEQRQAKAMLTVSADKWRQLNDSTTEIACVCRPDGEISLLGGPLERLVGLTPRQARGDWLFRRLHVGDRPLYLTAMADARGSEAPVTLKARVRIGATSPGEEGTAEYRWMSLQFRRSGQAGLPRTDSLSAEQTLVLVVAECDAPRGETEQGGQKDNAIAGELEQPLADIVSYADMLWQSTAQKGGLDREREYAERIHQSGLQILQTVQQDAGSSRLRSGRKGLEIEPVDLEAVIEGCRTTIEPVARKDDVHLEFTGGADLPSLPADRRALKQIALDLMSQAIETAGSGGSVLLVGRREDRGVALEVLVTPRDTDPLYGPLHYPGLEQGNSRAVMAEARSDDELSVARGLVELHGGSLASSHLADGGWISTLWLPTGAQGRRSQASDQNQFAPARVVARRGSMV